MISRLTEIEECAKMPQEMKNSNNNNANQESKGTAAAHAAADTLSYAVAIGTGWAATDLSVRGSMYKNFAAQGVFNELQASRKEQYKALLDDIAKGNKVGVPQRVHNIESAYRDLTAQKFKDLGVNGFQDWWKTLKRNQKVDALVSGLTVSGVVIGALMLVTNSREFNSMVARNFDSDTDKQKNSSGHAL